MASHMEDENTANLPPPQPPVMSPQESLSSLPPPSHTVMNSSAMATSDQLHQHHSPPNQVPLGSNGDPFLGPSGNEPRLPLGNPPLMPPPGGTFMSPSGDHHPPLLAPPPLVGGKLPLIPSPIGNPPLLPPRGPFIPPPAGGNPPLMPPPGGEPRPLLGPFPPLLAPIHIIRGPPSDNQAPPPPPDGGPVWVEHTTSDGQLYYSDPVTKKTKWEKPQGVRIIPFSQLEQPPSDKPLGPAPSVGGAPVPSGVPLVPQRVWSEHHNPEGKVYYYNKVTRQSVWDKPMDYELVMPLPANLAGPSDSIATSTNNDDTTATTTTTIAIATEGIQLTLVDVPKTGLLSTPPTSQNNAPPLLPSNEPDPPPELMDTSQKELLALVVAKLGAGPTPPPPVKPILATPKVEVERKGPHPIESVPVPGTPWSIVFTSDEKQFFFDSTNRKSIWNMPPELINSPTVLKILENSPWKKKRVGELEEPPSKKMRLAAFGGEDEESADEESKPVVRETKMEGIEVDLSAAVKAEIAERNKEMRAAELRATLPLDERQEMFKAMLLERGVSAFSTWEKELPKFVFDERYQLLLVKERKGVFDEFVAARVEEELKEKKQKVKEKRDTFMKFLQECKITQKTTFTEFIRQYARHEKFKIIDKMRERETLFNEYVTELKKVSKTRSEEQKQPYKKTDKERDDFLSMLKEQEDTLTDKSQWKKVKHMFHKDSRYKSIDSSSKREEMFNEYIKSLNRDSKEELIAASLREREREVQMSRSAQEKQWDVEREQLRRTEAQQHFVSLLVDLIKDPLSSWTESKRQLKRDQRWEMSDLIDIAEREKMFRDHVSQLSKKRRLQFRKLLEDTTKITLTMPWRKARKYIKDDVRYKGFSDNDHDREDEYDRYLRDKMERAKEDFKTLLHETKMITYRTKDTISSAERHLKDIIEVLKNDKRYLILDCIEEERHIILLDYIDELHEKGPPPPPTATYPSERLKK